LSEKSIRLERRKVFVATVIELEDRADDVACKNMQIMSIFEIFENNLNAI